MYYQYLFWDFSLYLNQEDSGIYIDYLNGLRNHFDSEVCNLESISLLKKEANSNKKENSSLLNLEGQFKLDSTKLIAINEYNIITYINKELEKFNNQFNTENNLNLEFSLKLYYDKSLLYKVKDKITIKKPLLNNKI